MPKFAHLIMTCFAGKLSLAGIAGGGTKPPGAGIYRMVNRMTEENGLAVKSRPDHPMVHVGAPVASQQSRILRVDETSVEETVAAGKFLAEVYERSQQESAKD